MMRDNVEIRLLMVCLIDNQFADGGRKFRALASALFASGSVNRLAGFTTRPLTHHFRGMQRPNNLLVRMTIIEVR